MQKPVIEKVTMFVSVAGLFSSLFLAECNRKANIELEEKKVESTLFLQAIQVNDKQTTLENLKFLLKMGALSKERETAIQNLTDSIYLDTYSQLYTASDTVCFLDIQVKNEKTDEIAYYQFVRGANVQISNVDSGVGFFMSQYTDNFGKAEFYYPRAFADKFVRISVVKKGYKNKVFEMSLPNENSPVFVKEVVMKEE